MSYRPIAAIFVFMQQYVHYATHFQRKINQIYTSQQITISVLRHLLNFMTFLSTLIYLFLNKLFQI